MLEFYELRITKRQTVSKGTTLNQSIRVVKGKKKEGKEFALVN